MGRAMPARAKQAENYYSPRPIPDDRQTPDDAVAAFLASRQTISCDRYHATISAEQCLSNQARPDNIVCSACTQSERASGHVPKRKGLFAHHQDDHQVLKKRLEKTIVVDLPAVKRRGNCAGCGRPDRIIRQGDDLCRRCIDRQDKGSDLAAPDLRGTVGGRHGKKTEKTPVPVAAKPAAKADVKVEGGGHSMQPLNPVPSPQSRIPAPLTWCNLISGIGLAGGLGCTLNASGSAVKMA